MKQKDIALIIVIAVISAVISFVVSGKIFVTPANRAQKVETVDVVKSDFTPPNSKYFNKDSFDPTQLVTTGNNNNPNPFNGSSQ